MAKDLNKNNEVAANNVAQIKNMLDGVISNMVKDPFPFVVAPDKDFTRNRTLTFKKRLGSYDKNLLCYSVFRCIQAYFILLFR